VTPTGAVGSAGAPPLDAGAIGGVREELLTGAGPTAGEVDGPGGSRYLASGPVVDAEGRPLAALVVTVPGEPVAATRRTIFRVLFGIALGGVLLSVGVAALAGRRITRPLRVLTAAARRLRGGELAARAGVRTADEVGSLGVAFDEMAEALEGQTEALSLAAAEEARLRRQVEGVMMSMNDGVVAIALDGTVTAVNRAAEHLLGLPAGETVGCPAVEVVVGLDSEGTPLEERLTSPVPTWAARATLLHPSGEPLPVAMGRTTITDDHGRPVGGVLVLRDVTAEEALERAKADFLANVSHELRTPLTPIKGFTRLLQQKALPRAKQLEFLAEIFDSADRLDRIVGILVDFAAIEAGGFAGTRERVEVPDLVEKVVNRWNGKAPDHRLVAEVEPEVPAVMGDAEALSRALLELLDNGVKYSPEGGDVEVRAAQRDGSVLISVRDHGIGFAEDRLDQLMTEFTQGDASSTRRFGGLGLGLPFVARIAEAHGGRLSASSRPGEGSTFTVELPAAG
jgi:PAS domain S-box-containing protein